MAGYLKVVTDSIARYVAPFVRTNSAAPVTAVESAGWAEVVDDLDNHRVSLLASTSCRISLQGFRAARTRAAPLSAGTGVANSAVLVVGSGRQCLAPEGTGGVHRPTTRPPRAEIVLNGGVAAVKATALCGRPAGRALTAATPPRPPKVIAGQRR